MQLGWSMAQACVVVEVSSSGDDCRFGVPSFDYVIERGREDAKDKVR